VSDLHSNLHINYVAKPDWSRVRSDCVIVLAPGRSPLSDKIPMKLAQLTERHPATLPGMATACPNCLALEATGGQA